jgi:hypothetical protein
MFKTWWNIGMLAVESQQAIWLRSMRFAVGGPTTSAEAQRMVSEKLAIAAPAEAGILRRDTPGKVVKRYRSKVRANKRRRSK